MTLTLALVTLTGCGFAPPVKVGFLSGLSGPGSELGTGVRRGLELAVRDLNRAGGIGGRPVELTTGDDGNDPAMAVRVLERFRREGVVAVVGPTTSTVIGTVLPWVNANRLPTISPTVSAESVTGQNDWFFRVMGGSSALGQVLGEYALVRNLTDVAVLLETSNRAYTGPVEATFRRVVEAGGGRVRVPVDFDQGRHPDYQALAASLGAASAYLVLANGYDTALVGQALAKAGQGAPVLATPWAMTPEVISLGGRQVERTVFAGLYDGQSRTPAWTAFQETYRNLYGEDPGFGALNAYDAFTLLVRALDQAGSDPQALREALASTQPVQGLQETFRLDAYGDAVRTLYLETIRDGRFVREGL